MLQQSMAESPGESFSHAGQSGACVSSCMWKTVDSTFLWVCYAAQWCNMTSRLKRCSWLVSHVLEQRPDDLRSLLLEAVVWWRRADLNWLKKEKQAHDLALFSNKHISVSESIALQGNTTSKKKDKRHEYENRYRYRYVVVLCTGSWRIRNAENKLNGLYAWWYFKYRKSPDDARVNMFLSVQHIGTMVAFV